jgi:hypothetical protein
MPPQSTTHVPLHQYSSTKNLQNIELDALLTCRVTSRDSEVHVSIWSGRLTVSQSICYVSNDDILTLISKTSDFEISLLIVLDLTNPSD